MKRTVFRIETEGPVADRKYFLTGDSGRIGEISKREADEIERLKLVAFDDRAATLPCVDCDEEVRVVKLVCGKCFKLRERSYILTTDPTLYIQIYDTPDPEPGVIPAWMLLRVPTARAPMIEETFRPELTDQWNDKTRPSTKFVEVDRVSGNPV